MRARRWGINDPVYEVDSPGLDPALAGYPIAAVRAALAELTSEERQARIEEALTRRLGSLAIVLENLFDPHNGAAVLRSTEAMGIQHVFTIEATAKARVSQRVSKGTEKWLDVHRARDVAGCFALLRARGFATAAAVPGGRVALQDLDVTRPLALVFGSEHEGLSPEARAACDVEFGIPMAGMVESLNLSVSVGISLYACAERRRAHLGRPGDLSPAEQDALRIRWYARDIRGAPEIVRRYLARPAV